MKITLTENSGSNKKEIPFIAKVEILTLTIDAGSTFFVPVHVSQKNGQPEYNIEVFGFRVRGDTPEQATARLKQLLAGLVNMMRLPSYVFVARRSRGIYPVYTIGSEVFATTPGGPAFRHIELAKVREYLSDYLHDMEIMGKPGLSDRLHVRGIYPETLGLIRPVFYLKKRIEGQTEFWAPVFADEARGSIYTYAANNKREVFLAGGKEVLNLHTIVSEVLITDERLQNPYDLRPDRLFPDQWEQLKSTLSEEGSITVAGVTLPVYRNGRYFIGLETRSDENRYGLFLGEDIADVRRRVEASFTRRGLSGRPQPMLVAA